MSACAIPNTAATENAAQIAQTKAQKAETIADETADDTDTPVFVQRVSFDTFDNRDARDFSLALRMTHRAYSYSGRSRTFLCGIDQNEYSESALDWLIEVLVEDGDEIIALRVVDPGSRMAAGLSVQQKKYRKDAEKVLERILRKNEESKAQKAMKSCETPRNSRKALKSNKKAVNVLRNKKKNTLSAETNKVIVDFSDDPDLPAGFSRNWNSREGAGNPESIARINIQVKKSEKCKRINKNRYCLATSPVPVIVVRPDRKRAEAKSKRQANPLRQSYMQILEKSNSTTDLRALDGAIETKPAGSTKGYLGIFGTQKYKRLSV
ncbi:uncharacterized protein T551_00037 [Pneumocystis jirovecii RU7]|uniref:UspA domain-containing protein n=1 Tax=Pneumocystis jirovecii (strain RU7) TaxID=1408657 RepID=A0A0W4ZW03_PNEJ7|nr:uncharacterized protein T551_00037 [Pneumocystis jirovecii RU7]KTW32552.1 hypothetical protein T551_00037 [Pneumocystis jirovecii RU7]